MPVTPSPRRDAIDIPVLPRLTDFVVRHARLQPAAEAVRFADECVGYAELAARMDALARAFVAAGVQPGDRIAVLCTPRPEFLVAYLAALRIGAVYVGLNPKYSLRELAYVLADCEPRMVLSLAAFEGRDHAADIAALQARRHLSWPAWRLDAGPAAGTLGSADELLALGRTVDDPTFDARVAAVGGADPAAIVYTSGSTGSPKGAVLPHRGLVYGPRLAALAMAVASPRVACDLPTNHVACLGDVCGSVLQAGGLLVFLERFDPARLLEAIEAHRLTNLMHLPTVLQMLLLHPDLPRRDLSSLRIVSWGGAAMAIDAIAEWRRRVGRLMVIYGMTETICNVTWADERCSDEQLATSVGWPDPALSVRLADDDGRPVPDGQPGEIQVRHEAIFLRYHGRAEATAAAFTADGHLRTGDLAVRLPDGRFSLVGRKSDMFKSGGYNVYPREVELVLEDHPAIAVAAVVAMPDPVFQEVGHAWLLRRPDQPAPDVAALRAWCRQRLANYKVPKRFVVGDELPLLPVGKVDKQELRRRSAALGQEAA